MFDFFLKWFKPVNPSPKSVLFICTANITRSPSAEGLFRNLCNAKQDNWMVSSAGVKAVQNAPANPVITLILKGKGIDATHHRAKRLNKKLTQSYQWLVVMENAHRDRILELFPEVRDRLFLYREIVGAEENEKLDMPDPTGKDPDDYLEMFEILEATIEKVYKFLLNKSVKIEFPDDY